MDQKYFADPDPHADLPAMRASLLTNDDVIDAKCVVSFVHFRSGNSTHKSKQFTSFLCTLHVQILLQMIIEILLF